MKKAAVLGGGGFIGSHLVERLKQEGYWVRAVDLKKPEFSESVADELVVGDLRDLDVAKKGVSEVLEVYQLAADMGGTGFIHSAECDKMRHYAPQCSDQQPYGRRRDQNRRVPVFLLFVGVHLSGYGSWRTRTNRRRCLSGYARQRVWLGETLHGTDGDGFSAGD